MQVMNDDVSPTLREQMKHHEPIVCYSVGADLTWQGCSGLTQIATTLDTSARTLSKSQPKTCAVIVAVENDPTLKIDIEGVGFSLRAREFKDPQIVCYAEKRFFEWHEDEKSVSLRAASGSYGGGSEVLTVSRQSRSIVRNRPQVDSATTSDARKVDS